ncbi:MAG: acetyltransferase [Clostridia bacterium]|nr:acetyltransferase [Clostridia bacterium]
MSKQVIIIGAGGHARVIADIVRSVGDIVVGFLDDAYECGKEIYDATILGKVEDCLSYRNECEMVIAIGDNKTRRKIAQKYQCNWYTAIHSSAVVSPSAKIGQGTVVMPNAVVNASARVGDHAVINTGAIVEHECEIGNFVHVSPKAVVCGVSSLGDNSWLGAGAVIVHVTRVCENVIIGAGSTVIKEITEAGTYVGTPARRIK